MADEKISAFGAAPDLTVDDFVAGYRAGSPNVNYRYAIAMIIAAAIAGVPIPTWAQTLAEDAESGGTSPVITAGDLITFNQIAGEIMAFFGGDFKVVYVVGNLLVKMQSFGIGDGTTNTVQMNANGLLQALRSEITSTAQGTILALVDAATIAWDWDAGDFAEVTITTDRTFGLPTNIRAGVSKTVWITQGGAGGHEITWNPAFKWPGGTAPVLSTAAGAIDILTFTSRGTDIYGTILNAFA